MVRRLFLSCSCLLACFGATGAFAAQSYDNCVGFIDSLPAVIGTQGVWCLRQNLSTAMSQGNAIEVQTNNVTIDCNDFKLGGLAADPPEGQTLAIGVRALDRHNVTVRNCNVRGFRDGINLYGGGGHEVVDNRVDNSVSHGILVYSPDAGAGSIVAGNAVYDTMSVNHAVYGTQGYGIYVTGDAVGNIVSGIQAGFGSAFGIYVQAAGTEVRGNTVRDIAAAGETFAYGIYVTDRVAVRDNTVFVDDGPVNGFGVYGNGSDNVCSRNTVIGFQTGYFGCEGSGGNLAIQ